MPDVAGNSTFSDRAQGGNPLERAEPTVGDPIPNSTFADRAGPSGAANKVIEAADTKDVDTLKELTKDELYELATDADIEGRSQMSKGELVDALRNR